MASGPTAVLSPSRPSVSGARGVRVREQPQSLHSQPRPRPCPHGGRCPLRQPCPSGGRGRPSQAGVVGPGSCPGRARREAAWAGLAGCPLSWAWAARAPCPEAADGCQPRLRSASSERPSVRRRRRSWSAVSRAAVGSGGSSRAVTPVSRGREGQGSGPARTSRHQGVPGGRGPRELLHPQRAPPSREPASRGTCQSQRPALLPSHSPAQSSTIPIPALPPSSPSPLLPPPPPPPPASPCTLPASPTRSPRPPRHHQTFGHIEMRPS